MIMRQAGSVKDAGSSGGPAVANNRCQEPPPHGQVFFSQQGSSLSTARHLTMRPAGIEERFSNLSRPIVSLKKRSADTQRSHPLLRQSPGVVEVREEVYCHAHTKEIFPFSVW